MSHQGKSLGRGGHFLRNRGSGRDIELLKSELAAKTQELRDAKQQLSRMPPSPALPALPGPPL